MTQAQRDRIVRKAARTVEDRKQKSTIVVDSPVSPVVTSENTTKHSAIVAGNTDSKGITMSLPRVNANRKGSSVLFQLPNGRKIKMPRTTFGVVVPDALSFNVQEWPLASGSAAKPKLSKEERAALRASMTPEQKVAAAREKAAKAQARAEKLAAALGV